MAGPDEPARRGRRRAVAGDVAGRPAATTPSCCAEGDRRNVVDRYRYWRLEAIVADLDPRRHPFHVAVENWAHDFNIGSVVRTANAFNAAGGPRRRRAALEPARGDGDRPLPARAPPRVGRRARRRGPRRRAAAARHRQPARLGAAGDVRPAASAACCCFGQEGPGLSPAARDGLRGGAVDRASTARPARSTPGAAAAVAMHAWVRRHLLRPAA